MLFFPNHLFDIVICIITVIFSTEKTNVFLFNTDIKIRVLTSKDVPLVLECANKSTSDKVKWLKENVPWNKLLTGNEDIKIDNETGSLEILKDEEKVYGNYTCEAANATIKYRVVGEYFGNVSRFVEKIIRNKRFKRETLNLAITIKISILRKKNNFFF